MPSRADTDHRSSEALVSVLGPDGAPLAATEVTVEQTRHAFLFGCIGFDLIPLANGEVDEAGEGSVFGQNMWAPAAVGRVIRSG